MNTNWSAQPEKRYTERAIHLNALDRRTLKICNKMHLNREARGFLSQMKPKFLVDLPLGNMDKSIPMLEAALRLIAAHQRLGESKSPMSLDLISKFQSELEKRKSELNK